MPETGVSKERALLATNGANPDRWERLFLVASAKSAADALTNGEPGASKWITVGSGASPVWITVALGNGIGETLSLCAPSLRYDDAVLSGNAGHFFAPLDSR